MGFWGDTGMEANGIGIDIAEIEELDTRIANAGAIRALEQVADQTCEYIVGIVALISAA